ncbi:MAG: hypothetical protein Q8Q73_14065 [Stagnimonas sp.]|nr:hypothetical protein [Stagnimonas sp.]
MAQRILLAWELGAGYGHLMPLRAIAEQLRARGHGCAFAVRELDGAERLGLHRFGPVYPAPLAVGRIRNPVRVQTSYASLLHNCGFDQEDALAGRLRAWRELMILSGCSAVLVDHAPTALLAARSLDLPAAATGTGFTLPPPASPLPAFPGLRLGANVLTRNEEQVLRLVNAALGRFGAAPLTSLRQLFDGVLAGLKTYPELDHYGLPRAASYLGLPDFSSGLEVDWGPSGEKRVLAYLRPFDGLEPLLDALARLPAQVLVRIAELDPARLAPYQRPGLVFIDRDIWLRQAVEGCDIFVNYGAHGATAEALLAGKPVLLLPYTMEQRLLAERARQLGAAVVLNGKAHQNPAAALRQLLEDDSLRAAAGRFAAHHADQDRRRIVPDWLERWLAAL